MDIQVGSSLNFKIKDKEYPFICQSIRRTHLEFRANFSSYNPPRSPHHIFLDLQIDDFKVGDLLVQDVEVLWFERRSSTGKYQHRHVYTKWWVKRK